MNNDHKKTEYEFEFALGYIESLKREISIWYDEHKESQERIERLVEERDELVKILTTHGLI
jgi:hypothetical protein